MKPLDPPHTIEGDPNATEMVRLWAAHNKMNVAMNIGCYQENGQDEAHAWGIMIADFAKHVARALNQRYGQSEEETIRKIKEGFMVEIENPTSGIKGE